MIGNSVRICLESSNRPKTMAVDLKIPSRRRTLRRSLSRRSCRWRLITKRTANCQMVIRLGWMIIRIYLTISVAVSRQRTQMHDCHPVQLNQSFGLSLPRFSIQPYGVCLYHRLLHAYFIAVQSSLTFNYGKFAIKNRTSFPLSSTLANYCL
jgi:hypothetical protein